MSGSFNRPPDKRMIFPFVEFGGAKECCRDFENRLESLLKVPDVVIVSIEAEDGRCCGIADPVPSEALDDESLAIVSHTPTEWNPYRICASLSFLKKAKRTVFVLPTKQQSDQWETILSKKTNLPDEGRKYAALHLLGNENISVFSV